MVEKISLLLTNKLSDNDQSEEEKEILLFGITRIVEDIPKYLILITICYFLNIIKETTVVLLICMSYKVFVGGAHAKTNIECLIYSILFFLTPVMLAKYINYDMYIYYIIMIATILFSVYVILKIVPSDTEEIPIINSEKRKKSKIYALILLVILLIIANYLNNIVYMKIIVYTILITNLFCLNSFYKLLRCKRGKESLEYREFY